MVVLHRFYCIGMQRGVKCKRCQHYHIRKAADANELIYILKMVEKKTQFLIDEYAYYCILILNLGLS